MQIRRFHQFLIWALALSNPVIYVLGSKSIVIGILISLVISMMLFVVIYHLKSNSFNRVFVLNGLTILALFMSAEVIFRYLYPQYIIPNIYESRGDYFYNKPNLELDFEDKEYVSRYHTNVQGHRISDTSDPAKEIQSCDWLFLGDSYTQGAQVNFEQLYTSMLNNYFPTKIILNAGISGFDIAEEYSLMLDLFEETTPSRIFLQVCNFNDFMNVRTNDYSLLERLSNHSDLIRYIFYDFIYQGPDNLPAGRWTEPFYSSVQQNKDFNIFYIEQSEGKKNDIKKFFEYLNKMKLFLDSKNIELSIILLPSKEEAYPKYYDEVVSVYNLDTNLIDLNYPNKLMSSWCDSNAVMLINVKKHISNINDDIYFDYDEHLNSNGHQILAGMVADEMGHIPELQSIKKLSKSNAGDRYPTYINNGTEILYQSIRDGNSEIFITDSSFSIEYRITHNDVDDFHPAYSNELQGIIFSQGDTDYKETNIVYYDLRSQKSKILTPDTYEYGAIPTSLNIDGSFAYAAWHYDHESHQLTNSRIAIGNMAKSNNIYLTSNDQNSWRPAFSDDRSKIVFIAETKDNYDIFLYDMITNTTSQLTFTNYDEWDPSFSTDGKYVVYAGNPDENFDLYLLNVSTTEIVQLTKSIGDEWDPVFDPGGKKILYAGEYGLVSGIYEMQLY
jgi:hypothetical protein